MTLTAPCKTPVSHPHQYADHARAVAKAFSVALVEQAMAPEKAGAAKQARLGFVGVVFCAPVTDETTYAVAMHEIGHVLSPLGSMAHERASATPTSVWRLKLDEEQAAWEWAHHYALDWTPAMEAVKAWALSTYETGYADHLRNDANAVRQATAPRKRMTAVGDFGKTIKWHS